MATQKYSAEQVIRALKESRGLVSPAAAKLGCDPVTVRRYMARYPSVQQACEDQRDRFVDNAEIKLMEAVEIKGEPWAIALVVKTLGKKRGYVERSEQTGADGAPLNPAAYDLSRFSTEEIRDILARAAPGADGEGTSEA